MPVQRSAPLDHSLEFAGYDLVRCLGRGGMGEVWSVVRRGLYDGARPLAIKVLLPELSDDVQFRGIFVREGRISMQLSSANIVPVIELGLHDGLLFMVMERVDGVGLVAGGIVFAQGRQIDNPASQLLRPEGRNYRPPGVAIMVTGGVLAAAGVALLVLDRVRARRSAPDIARLSFQPNDTSAGLALRF
ncbi:MAG: hypothetical protein AAGF11_43645 [Myxococcota bacterium]